MKTRVDKRVKVPQHSCCPGNGRFRSDLPFFMKQKKRNTEGASAPLSNLPANSGGQSGIEWFLENHNAAKSWTQCHNPMRIRDVIQTIRDAGWPSFAAQFLDEAREYDETELTNKLTAAGFRREKVGGDWFWMVE
jgi:hypothetical protein